MKYRMFAKNTPRVSEIGLGAWQLGEASGWKGLSEKEALEMVAKALDLGVNFFDTAPNYGHGTGEARLGKALKGADRSRVAISTKFGHTASGTLDFSPGSIRTSLEGSLRRLQTDYVDSLLIHNPPAALLDGTRNDHYEILERLQEEGKIRAYGASLDTEAEMRLLMETTNAGVVEAFFNILHQDIAGAFDRAREKGVAIIVKVPLDSGWLSGKYHSGSTFGDIRSRWSREDIQTRARLVGRVKDILEPAADLARQALAFCLAYEAVSTVIPGNVSIAQLTSNVRSVEQRLARETVRSLEAFYRREVAPLKLPW